MPRIFVPRPFRYNGVDYPYGEQDIGDDSLARTLADAGHVTLSAASGGGAQPLPYSSEPADRALTADDADRTLTCAAARSFTVNAGMPPTFGPGFYGAGAVTIVQGSGVVVNDDRQSGGTSPYFAALKMVAKDTYTLRGSKA